MPRFHFHTMGDCEVRDEEGCDLPDMATARQAAVTFTSELLKETGVGVYENNMRVTVSTHDGLVLWDIFIVATEAAAVMR